jgi:hypothetical protein
MLRLIGRFGSFLDDNFSSVGVNPFTAYCLIIGLLMPPTKTWQVERRPIVTHNHYRSCDGDCSYRYDAEYASPLIGSIYCRQTRTKFGALIARQTARGFALVFADI